MTYYVIETNTGRDLEAEYPDVYNAVMAHGPFSSFKEASEWAAQWIGYNPWTVYQQGDK